MRRTLSGASRAAIVSRLLRSPGSNSPLQYDFSGSIRSACPAAFARPSMYAAKRLSCGPGAEGLVPTKQFYTNLFFYNTVVLDTLAKEMHSGYLETRIAVSVLCEATTSSKAGYLATG